MKYILSLCLTLAVISGLYVNSHREHNLDLLVQEYKKEYKAYKEALNEQNIQEQTTGEALTWQELKDLGEKIARRYDIPPAVLIAQMGLESGRGTSHYCQVRNNCFGLGAYDGNPNNAFDFPTQEAGIEFYARLISQNKIYEKAYNRRSNPYAMIQAIKDAGYATDSRYVSKITSMPEFREYVAN